MWLTLTRPTQLWNFSYGREQPTSCFFSPPSSAFTFFLFLTSPIHLVKCTPENIRHSCLKVWLVNLLSHSLRWPPLTSPLEPQWKNASGWELEFQWIRGMPHCSLFLSCLLLSPDTFPQSAGLASLFMSLLVEGDPGTSHAQLKVGAGFVPCLYDMPEVLRYPVPVSFLSGTGSHVCPTQLCKERQAATVWGFWFSTWRMIQTFLWHW